MTPSVSFRPHITLGEVLGAEKSNVFFFQGNLDAIVEAEWRAILTQLRVWMENPSATEDEGTRPLSLKSLSQAAVRAVQLRDDSWVPPTRLVPDGDGGVAFEWREGTSLRLLTIGVSGLEVLREFRQARLVLKRELGSRQVSLPAIASGKQEFLWGSQMALSH